jgi:hypothetical protein
MELEAKIDIFCFWNLWKILFLGGPHRRRCSASDAPSLRRSRKLKSPPLKSPPFFGRRPNFCTQSLGQHYGNVLKTWVLHIKSYFEGVQSKKIAPAAGYTRCSTCNVTHPQHHQSHHAIVLWQQCLLIHLDGILVTGTSVQAQSLGSTDTSDRRTIVMLGKNIG